MFFTFKEFIVQPKKEEVITKISLNSVAVTQVQPVEPEPTPPEPEPEPIPEPIIEKPTPIKKVHKEHKKPQKKPVEKIIEQKQEVTEVAEVVQPAPITPPNTKPTEDVQTTNHNQAEIDDLRAKYLAKVKAKVEKNKVYPKAAKRLNQTGKVEVSFDIRKNGKIENLKISKKSAFERLDEATLELLLKISAFDEIPDELKKDVLSINIPVIYDIN